MLLQKKGEEKRENERFQESFIYCRSRERKRLTAISYTILIDSRRLGI